MKNRRENIVKNWNLTKIPVQQFASTVSYKPWAFNYIPAVSKSEKESFWTKVSPLFLEQVCVWNPLVSLDQDRLRPADWSHPGEASPKEPPLTPPRSPRFPPQTLRAPPHHHLNFSIIRPSPRPHRPPKSWNPSRARFTGASPPGPRSWLFQKQQMKIVSVNM